MRNSKYLLQLLPLSFSPSEETLLAVHFFPTLTPFLKEYSAAALNLSWMVLPPSLSITVLLYLCVQSLSIYAVSAQTHSAVAAIPADVHEGSPNVPQTSYSSLENSQSNSESGMQGRSRKGRKLTGKLTVPMQGAGKWVS